MKIRNILILIIFTFIEIHTQPMYYYYNGSQMLPASQVNVAWNQTTINISAIPNYKLPSTVTEMQANMAIDFAISTWDFAGNYYNYTRVSNQPAVTVAFSDNIIHFGGMEGSAGGITSWDISQNKFIVYGSTGILLNNTAAFASNFNYTIFTPNANNNEVHLQSVILHELGHVFGLSHNLTNPSSTMYDTLKTGQVYSLHQEDKDGMLALYDATVNGFGSTTEDITFDPLPGSYSVGQTINMVNSSSNSNYGIVYKIGYSTESSSDAESDVPDITNENWTHSYSIYNTNSRTLKIENCYYYFKAILYDETNQVVVSGQQIEGSYFCHGTVGVGDAIIFYPGTIVGGQIIETIFEPNHLYLPGSDAYILNFYDADYSGTVMNTWDNWKCYASYGCGEVLIMDSPSFNIPSLPDGYNWERDGNGNVIARMEIGGTDSDGTHHDTSAEIKISGVTTNFITSGTLTANSTWCGDLTITGNTIIPVGKQLTILPNSNITFTNNSSLIVEGSLVIESDVIDFVTQNSTLKNGIKINSGGTATITDAEIKNAYTGIYINGGSATIDGCIIRNGYSGIHLYDTDYSTSIKNTHIYEQTVGVDLYYSTAVISYSEIDNNYIGISCYSSSPQLIYSTSSGGYNNIHTNSFGIMASYNSNPFLGRQTCFTFGGSNFIDLNTTKDINLNNYCTVYAENNYWGGSSGSYYEGTGCIVYDTPFLTSPPQIIKITPEEEMFNNKFPPQVTSSGNTTEQMSLVTSTNDKSDYNESWQIEWKLLYARNLMRVKKYNQAAKICESVITEFPDSARSYLALDLLWQSRKNDDKTLFNQYVDNKAKSKVKKQLYGVAELMLAFSERANTADSKERVAVLDVIGEKYKDTPLVEHVLFQKFMFYLYEENNIELAKTTSAELGKLFPESESYYASQRHLGNDVVKPTEPLLAKNAANEETTEIPQTYELLGNYPNPFNPSTTIKYALPYSSNVELTIYDITGKVVKVFNENVQSAGYQNIVWFGDSQQGSRVSSGIYFYRFKAASIDGSGKVFEKTAKMLLLK